MSGARLHARNRSWEVNVDAIRALVSKQLPLDLFDGKAYLGIIPFHMTDVRPRGTVNVPGISNFPELNVRTYVNIDGRPGVYFLSLEAHTRLAVETARLTYGLPYFKATMQHEKRDGWHHYSSQRTDGRASRPDAAGHQADSVDLARR